MAHPQQINVGTVLGGDFRMVKPLGAGGMGVVFLAEQLSTNRKRAVKVMRSALVDDDKQRERFVREAKATAAIDSAHVVEVISAGVSDAGVPWLAMEFLRGKDLAHYLEDSGPMPMAQVLTLFEQLCHALGAAHESGIVHRDVKPENVFLARTNRVGGELMVKVLDFGIAKVVDASKTGGTAALGSPLWMAPEQTNPDVPISPATDVWALGLLAFWLLTGDNYWKSAKGKSFNIHEMLREVLFDALDTATQRIERKDLDAARLPPGFDGWFERCVHREPAARFKSAAEAYAGLRALTDEAAAPLFDHSEEPEEPVSSAEPEKKSQSTAEFLNGLGLGTNHVLKDYVSTPPPISETDDTILAPETTEALAQAATQGDTMAQVVVGANAKDEAPSRAGRWVMALLALASLAGLVWFLLLPESTRTPDGPLPPDTSDTVTDVTPSSEPVPPEPSQSAPPQPTVAPTSESSTKVAPAPMPTLVKVSPSPAPPTPQPAPSVQPTARASASAAIDAPPPPFNHNRAKRTIDRRSKTARFVCKSRRTGPRAVAGTITFMPDGSTKVSMPIRDRTTSTGMCVMHQMRSARIGPFTGDPQQMGFAVALN